MIKKFLTTTALAIVLAGSVSTPAEAGKLTDALSSAVHSVENAVKTGVDKLKSAASSAFDKLKSVAGPVGQLLVNNRAIIENIAQDAIAGAKTALSAGDLAARIAAKLPIPGSMAIEDVEKALSGSVNAFLTTANTVIGADLAAQGKGK